MLKLALAAAAVATVGGVAQAATYDPAAQGANAANFVYGYFATPLSSFTQYDATNFRSGGACQINTGAATTCFEANPPNFLGVYFSPVDGQSNTAFIFASDVTFHPGQNGELSALAFVAPTAGSYSFNGLFRAVDAAAGNGVTYTTAQGGGILAPGGSQSFGFTQVLAAGERAYFTVGNNGSYGYDTTGLQLSVSSVPEPATWALLIAGFGLVGGAMRRRTMASPRHA